MDKLFFYGNLLVAAFIFGMGILIFTTRNEDVHGNNGPISGTIWGIILCAVGYYYAKHVLAS